MSIGLKTLAAPLAFALVAATLLAADKPKTETGTVTGELVDTKCYVDLGQRGEKHRKCAAACAKDGTPVGLVAEDGTYYVVAIQAPFFEPYMAQTVRLTGKIDKTSHVLVPTKMELQKEGKWSEVKLPEQIM